MPVEIPYCTPATYQQAMVDAGFAWFQPWNHPVRQHHLYSPTKLYGWQRQALVDASVPVSRCLVSTNNESGKALPDDTLIPTPDPKRPFVEIRSLRPGDLVFAGDGSVTSVSGVYPKGVKDCVEFVLDGGECSVVCSTDHLWPYLRGSRRYTKCATRDVFEVASASDIIAMQGMGEGRSSYVRGEIPAAGATQWQTRRLPLPPYLLGALIGDGCMSGTSKIGFSNIDKDILRRVEDELPSGHSLVRYCEDKPCDYTVVSGGAKGAGRKGALRLALERLGLMQVNSRTKFIPEMYLYSAPPQRLDLLRGLMDTDGCVGKCATCEYATVSPVLARQVAWLVRSLGGKCKVSERETLCNGKVFKSFRLALKMPSSCPFFCGRKAGAWRPVCRRPNRVITEIRHADPQACTCIAVNHASRTFLCTENMLVTHNTSEIIPTFGLSIMTAFPGAIVNSTAGSEYQIRDQLWRYLENKLRPWATTNSQDDSKWYISTSTLMIKAPRVNGLRSTWFGRVPRDADTAEGYHRAIAQDDRGNPILTPVALIFDEAKSLPPSLFRMGFRINPDFWLVISTPPDHDDPSEFVDILDQETLAEWHPQHEVLA